MSSAAPSSSSKEVTKKDLMKKSNLKICFAALVDRKQLNLDVDVLQMIIKKELLIKVDDLEENLVNILPYMLVHFMRNWPGWQKSVDYFSGKLLFKEWFEKFWQYVVVKLNYVIKNAYNIAIEELVKEKVSEVKQTTESSTVSTEHGTQTDALAYKGFSPYSIEVTCPPQMLNNIVFCGSNDDVILRGHPELTWTDISTKELLNWPFVHVEFHSRELSFSRKVCIDYQRHISLLYPHHKQEKPAFIQNITILDSTVARRCYSNNLLKNYVRQYKKVLNIAPEDKFPKSKFEEVCLILDEFIADVEEIDVNKAMPTNTSVLFNIGKGSYTRNKKLAKSYSKTATADVGFMEYITPRVELSLNYFKAFQDLRTIDEVSFVHLNRLTNMIKQQNENFFMSSVWPHATYTCTFCTEKFTNKEDIMKHFKETHKMEQYVLCMYCKQSFYIYKLAGARWSHVCKVKKPMPKIVGSINLTS